MPSIAFPGIAATGALGSLTITGGAQPQNISLPGIAMSALLGMPTIGVGGGSQNVSLPGISATGVLGTPTLGFVASGTQNITLSGITATATLGTPTIALGGAPGGGGSGVATPGVAPNRLPYPDVVRASQAGEVLDPRGVQANFEKLSASVAAADSAPPAATFTTSAVFTVTSATMAVAAEDTQTLAHGLNITGAFTVAGHLEDGSWAHACGWRVITVDANTVQIRFRNGHTTTSAQAILKLRFVY